MMNRSEREEDGALAGNRAEGEQETRGNTGRGDATGESEGVMTLVCIKCGTEYYSSEEGPPTGLTCEKCGNTVFRSFFSPVEDEVADDFHESTARDVGPDDAEGEVLPGDIMDLSRE